MKKEESNIGQLSLFDVIDGGKHGEAENVNLIKIKHKIMVDAAEFESIDEIFSGYSKSQLLSLRHQHQYQSHQCPPGFQTYPEMQAYYDKKQLLFAFLLDIVFRFPFFIFPFFLKIF